MPVFYIRNMTAKKSPNTLSVSQAARYVGVARQTLAGWLVEAGIDYGGGVDLPAFLKWKFAHEREARRDEIRKKFAYVEQTIEEAQAAGFIDSDEAKRRKLVADMAIREIELAERRGELVRTAEVAAVVQGEYAILREAFLTLPGKSAPRLGMANEDDRRKVLEDDVDTILSELTADARYALEKEKVEAAAESDGD